MSQDNHNREVRRRSPTMLKLEELADRLKKVLRIKEEINSGQYKPDREKIAEAVINKGLQE